MSYYKMVNIRRLGAYRIFPRSFSHTRLGLRPRPVLKTTSGIVSAPDPHVTPSRKRVWYLTEEAGHGHVMYGIIAFQSTGP